MGDMFSSRKSEQNTEIFNEQAAIQGNDNQTVSGGVTVQTGPVSGEGAGNITLDFSGRGVTLAALREMGQLTNQTVVGVLAAQQLAQQRSSDLVAETVARTQDLASSVAPVNPDRLASDSISAFQKQLLIFGSVLVALVLGFLLLRKR